MEILCMVNSPQCPQHIHYTSLKNAGYSFVKAAFFPHFTTNFSVFWTWALMSHVIYKLGPSWACKLHQPYCVWSAIILLITSSFYCYSLQMFPGVTMLKVWEEVRKRKLRRLLSRSGSFEGFNQSFFKCVKILSKMTLSAENFGRWFGKSSWLIHLSLLL